MKMMRFWWAVLFIPLALVAGYMVWIAWQAGDDSRWFFATLAALFLILGSLPFLPKSRKRKAEESVSTTRFASSWVLHLYLFLFFGALFVALLARVYRAYWK